jgi:hypothetical protein
MSFQNIRIYRDIPVINNYLALPPNREEDKNQFYCAADCAAETQVLSAGSTMVRLGSGNATGGKVGRQRWLRIASITPNTWYSSNPVQDLYEPGNVIDNIIDVE